ncbi:MAG: hypothetical protein ACODAJ_04145 [Planctomycetota bacterium]
MRSLAPVLPLLLCLASVGCAGPLVDKDREATARWLERRWQRIERLRPRMGVRELFGFALEATSIQWHPERVAQALAYAEQMQDRDPESRTYGNFKWYWESERPVDRNAVEFSMQQAVLVWMHFRDGLDAEGTERLERLIRYSVEGIRRHRVPVRYTNIYLMKIWNCIAIGEHTGRPALAKQGHQMLDQWLLYTWESGIHEYLSPTYYGVDIQCLALVARFAKRAQERRKAEAALRLFYTDIAANWFAPCQRLGGAHSRDYDYLTGHGYLDTTLRAVGWLDDDRPVDNRTFFQLCRWQPPAGLRQPVASQVPRMVRQRWGLRPWERAAHYVGETFSLGSAGATYGPMDKPLTVNLAGGPKQPMVYFFMDARGDPYGKKRFQYGASGHSKALHIQPFLTTVQRGGEVLLLASADPEDRMFQRRAPEPACLLSHVVIPADVGLWLGEEQVKPADGPQPVPRGAAAFLRFRDAAVGVRVLYATGIEAKPAPIVVVSDGVKHGAMRLTAIHSPTPPDRPATVAVWVRAAEGLDDEAFARFRRAFAEAEVELEAEGDRIDVRVPGYDEYLDNRVVQWLRLAADVAKRQRLAAEGDLPEARDALLAVNGTDHGREILGEIGPIQAYRRLLKAAERGEREAAKAGDIIEAEAAALVIAPFQAAKDPAASGGRFLWVPGQRGEAGGSTVARALWLVHVPKAGSYYLWGRVQAPTPSDDSFFVRVRQGSREVLSRTDWHTGQHQGWDWTPLVAGRERKAVALRLARGVALVEVRCREDGTRLDALYLAARPDAPPPSKTDRP